MEDTEGGVYVLFQTMSCLFYECAVSPSQSVVGLVQLVSVIVGCRKGVERRGWAALLARGAVQLHNSALDPGLRPAAL